MPPQIAEDTKQAVVHSEYAEHHTEEPRTRFEDDALRILDEAGPVDYDPEEEKRLLRKIDFWVLIPMMITYTLCHLDKNALSYGSVFDLQKETHLVGKQYAWLGSIVYLVQLVVQPLSAVALVKLPLAKWICFNILGWGIAVSCMAACTNWTGLMITRALVGGFEATIAPTFISICQMWWRRREQTYRNTFWLLSSPIASLIGPILAFAVGHIHTAHLVPYQSIFLFLGCITLAFIPLIFYMMPDDIVSARFLTLREKAIVVERLRVNNTGTRTSVWKWSQVREVFTDPKTYGWGFMLMITAIPSSGIGTFGGLITKGFGFTSLQTILFQIPYAVMQAVVLLGATWCINRFKIRFPIVAIVTLFPIGGAIGLRLINRAHPRNLLAGYYLVQLYSCIQPLLYSWANMNAAGTTKQRVLSAFLFVCQCAGNVAGPQVYLDHEKPYYFTGIYTDIGCWTGLVIMCFVMGGYLKLLNKRQAARREAAGGIANLQDMSIMTMKEAAEYTKTLGLEGELVNQHAFEDQTDLENPDFQYVY